MACLGSHTPRFVNNDYETAEIIYSTEHKCHKVLPRTQATSDIWAPPKKRQHYCCITTVSIGSATREDSLSTDMAALSARREHCYGCCVRQKRINVSAVPTAPQIFFESLRSRLAYHRFSEQCTQWDTARQLVLQYSQLYSTLYWRG